MMRQLFLYIMALFYGVAGVNHFLNPRWYLAIIPKWLPFPEGINYVSGACEIVLAILLIPESTRPSAAWGIIILLIAIFPANIQMSVNYYQQSHPLFWITVVRLPLQLALIWWAWRYTKL